MGVRRALAVRRNERIMTITQIAQSISDSPIGAAIAGSQLVFPLIEGAHLLSLAISIGLLFVTDLRLLGLFLRQVPVDTVLTHLRPWVLSGFVVTFATGGLLFWAEAATLVTNPAFPIKLVFIALAGINALVFELRLGRRAAEWAQRATPPIGVKLAAASSLLLWSVVVVTGRLIPYLG